MTKGFFHQISRKEMCNMDNRNSHKYITWLCALVITMTSMAGCSASSNSSSSKSESKNESATTTAAATTQPIVTLAPETTQIINETPASYEAFGIDKTAKEEFKNKIKENTKIPVISITTKDDEDIVSREKYTSCVVDVFNTDEHDIDEASAGIKVRGNSSAFYGDVAQILSNQVPYRIKFDTKTNMLGLNNGAQCKSWVLLKSDWDLIRNDIAFRFGRTIMGEDNFCSDAQLVHVYVNEEFKGIYLLCEQCQINPERVDITEPENGYTGWDIGYYLELDNYATSEETNHYIEMDYGEATVTDIEGETRQFVPAEYSIKNDLYSQNQIDFISKYLNNIFTIVYEACENGKFYSFDENYDLVEAEYTTAEETVNAVMDVQSVVDMYMLYEIVHDYDCGEGSFFMCVDFSPESKCTKLKFTSPWDFNWAYNDSTEQYHAAAFTDQSFVNQNGDRSNPWFIILMKQDWFVNQVKEKWTVLKESDAIKSCIEEEKAYIEEYKDDLNKTDEWATESATKLFDWIENRIYWLNSEWVIKQ